MKPRLEYQRIEQSGSDQSTIVMLHEGLGSVAMWRDFPARLASTTGAPIMLYSRRGYGRSDPLSGKRPVTCLHEEALEVLPALLDELEIDRPVLFGHSDGASIALIYAGGSGRSLAGVVAMAPHVMVEEISVKSIAAARQAYQTTDLRARLARYHDNVDEAFGGWNDMWLDPAFRDWNIEELLPRITAPILAIQGEEDEYATMAQIDRIEHAAPHVTAVRLPNCRHSPHRDQPAVVLEQVAHWLKCVVQPDQTPRSSATAREA